MGQQLLTLDSVLSNIQQSNPQLKVYDEQVKSQDALVSGASAWKAPMFGVSTFMTPYDNFSRPANQQDGSLMLTAEQGIPNRSKIKSTEAYLNAQSAIIKEAKAENYNDLRAVARSAYFNILTLQKLLNYQSKNLHILQNLKKLAEIRYTYNKAGLSQIYAMEAKIYELQNRLTSTEANIKIGKIRLSTLMYRHSDSDFEIDTNKTYRNQSISSDLNRILSDRSTLKQVDAQIESLSLEHKMIASEAKPEFNIQFNHMFTYNNTRPNQFSLMGGITIPIAPWAAKSYQSKMKANEFDAAAMQLQKENLLNNLTGMIKTQEEHLMHMNMELEQYETKILPSLQKSYEVTLLDYQENKEELPTVLNLWKEVNDSQMDYLNLMNEYYQMLAEYERNVEE